jgi:hypothetical protein
MIEKISTEDKSLSSQKVEKREGLEKSLSNHNILRTMKDSCDFLRGLNRVIGQIRDEKLFIDTSIEKVLDELDSKKKENEELNKINRALEELNVAKEKEFQDSKSELTRKEKLIFLLKSKE